MLQFLGALLLVALLTSVALAGGSSSWRLVAAGDITCGPSSMHQAKSSNRPLCRGERVARTIVSQDPDKILALGDILQDGIPRPEKYLYFQDLWRPLVPETHFVPGNHDYFNKKGTAGGYLAYLHSRSLRRSQTGEGGGTWSSWSKGGWRMLGLDSNCKFVDCALDGKQLLWLQSQLESTEESCSMAYFHHPLFSVGRSRARQGVSPEIRNIWNLLYAYGVDVVLNGHQHYYEEYRKIDPRGRRDSAGIRQFIVGTGGYSLYAPGGRYQRRLKNARFARRSYGALVMDLKNGGYRWGFRTISGYLFGQGGPARCNRGLTSKQRVVQHLYKKRMQHLRFLHSQKTKKFKQEYQQARDKSFY